MDFAFLQTSQKVFVSCDHPLYNRSHQIFYECKTDELKVFTQPNFARRLFGHPQMFLVLSDGLLMDYFLVPVANVSTSLETCCSSPRESISSQTGRKPKFFIIMVC